MSDKIAEANDQKSQKLDVSVKVYPAQQSQDSKLLATATVSIGGCFAIRGVRIMDSEKGAFVSMPQRKTAQGEYKDVCFPTTSEMRKELNNAVGRIPAHNAAGPLQSGVSDRKERIGYGHSQQKSVRDKAARSGQGKGYG